MSWWNRSRWRPAARTAEVPAAGMLAVTVEGVELVLGRSGDQYFAVQRRCAHRGADLALGFVAGDRVVCRQHGWRFSTETGKSDGMFDACLTVYRVRVVGDAIEVRL